MPLGGALSLPPDASSGWEGQGPSVALRGSTALGRDADLPRDSGTAGSQAESLGQAHRERPAVGLDQSSPIPHARQANSLEASPATEADFPGL